MYCYTITAGMTEENGYSKDFLNYCFYYYYRYYYLFESSHGRIGIMFCPLI